VTTIIRKAKTPTKDGKTRLEMPKGYTTRNRKLKADRAVKAWKAKNKGTT